MAAEENQVLGIVKNISHDLRELPIQTHGAVLGILNTLLQHRLAIENNKRAEEVAKAKLEEKFAVTQ